MKGTAIALPAVAAAAFFLLRGKASAATPKPPVIVPSPAGAGSVQERMARVLATGDPAAIRFEAGRLQQEGYTSQAAELERAAATIEAERVKPPVPGVPSPAPVKPPLTPPLPPVVIVTPTAPTLPLPLPTVPVPAPVSTLLRRGDTGPRVVLLQQRLASLGYSIGKTGADGKFGPSTEAAVKAFQSSNGLKPVDGIVGPVTQAALASPAAKGPTVKPVATPVVIPTPVLPAGPPPSSASSPAGKAPTITAALRSLPALLRNGKASKPPFPSPASSGQAVRDWQNVLLELGFLSAKPDGKFGDATEAATRAFQTAANVAAAKAKPPKKALTVDGIVGPATVARAAEARIVSTGPAVFTGEHFGYDPGASMMMRAPSSPLADSPLPGVIPPMMPVGPDPSRALASRLTHMLNNAPKGQEDRTLVALFQQSNGLKPTGHYGPSAALALAQRFGIVPPRPLYWTESRTGKSKQNYRDALRMLSERDPQRAEEWLRAAVV